MIGYATLIAPVISSKLKPGMFISLMCIHVEFTMRGIYTITPVMAASIAFTGRHPVKPTLL